MKKLIMLFAVVLAATMTQAASVKWGSGTNGNGFKDPTGASLKNSALYTMVVTFYDADMNVIGTSQSTKAGATGSFGTTYSGYDFAADTTYYASAIIKANDGSYERIADASSFTIAANGADANIVFFTGAGFDENTAKWGDWQSAPEPTGAMLIMLGVAALALRRKQK